MYKSLNKVMLIGNVGGEVKIKKSKESEKEIAIFTLATEERWKNRMGEEKKITEWHRIVIFVDGLIKIAKRYIKKGDKIYVEGKIKKREYIEKEEKKSITEIILTQYNSNLQILKTKEEALKIEKKKSKEEEKEDLPF